MIVAFGKFTQKLLEDYPRLCISSSILYPMIKLPALFALFRRAFGFALLVWLFPALGATEAAKINFNVAAGEAGRTLKQFAQQAKREIMFPVQRVDSIKTNALTGELTVKEGLDRLLAGTNLRAFEDEKTGALIVQRVDDPNAPRAAQMEKSDRPSILAKTEAGKPDGEPGVLALDTFRVSGFFGSLAAAADAKRAQTGIAEVVAAEDIGKLPDVSIAESIARLPGLAAQRVAGRAQVISVRGLSPDFANTLLNGREQVSTGDNRGVEFDQYPSELINSVTVFKTPDASLVGQGLSGTIGLQTVNPLSYGRRTLAFNARYEVNSLDNIGAGAKHTGSRISGTYIDQFAGKTLGVAIGYSHLDTPILAQETKNYSPWFNTTVLGVPAGTWHTNGITRYARTGTNTRDGVVGLLEWRPSPAFSSVIDLYYSKFRREETAYGLETPVRVPNATLNPGFTYTATTIVNNSLVGGTVANVYPVIGALYNDRVDKLTAIGWKNQYNSGKWKVTADLSYSKADRNERNTSNFAQYKNAAGQPVNDTATYNFDTGSFPTLTLGLDYSDPARVQVGPTSFGAGYGAFPRVTDELNSYRLVASRALDVIFSSVDFGLNYGDRTKNKEQPETSLGVPAFRALPSDVLLPSANLGFGGVPAVIAWNVPAAIAAAYNPYVPNFAASFLVPKTWGVEEKITTSFLQGNMDREFGRVHLRGNIGMQVQNVDQSATSKYWDSTAPAGQNVKPVKAGKTYTDVLPSANFAFDLGGDFIVRTAVAKQVARPRLDYLKSAFVYSVNASTGIPSGNGGNPRLDPWKATAYDLSFEKYFANKKGYVAVAGFYKELDTYIYVLTNPGYDFASYVASSPVPVTTTIGNFTQPFNGTGGKLKGLEFTASVPFSIVSPSFDGFGVVASVSLNDSSITVNDSTGATANPAIGLPGLSKTVTNLTVYYEKRGFSARLSRRQRSDFIGEISGFGADRALSFVAGEALIDAQLGYEFKKGPLKGLGLVVQGYNLTNAAYQSYSMVKERVVDYVKYGRTFQLGANYKF